MSLTYGSLFTGIGGFDLGFDRAGMKCEWQCEIDRNCRAVLLNHWYHVKRYEDVRAINAGSTKRVDLVCGGFLCQDLSIAGKRAGLAGERSGLWFEYHRILSEIKPRWVVIENVPGLLSSHGGEDFAVILSGLAELGYLSAWRILDAQYFGVAQRRRRVFIVASLGNGRAAEVLFEREGMSRDTPPSREAGAEIAHNLTRGPSSGYRYDSNGEDYVTASTLTGQMQGQSHQWAPYNEADNLISGTLPADYYKQGGNGMGEMENGIIGFTPRRTNINPLMNQIPTQNAGNGGFGAPAIAFNIQHNDGGDHKRQDRPNGGMYVNETETAPTVGSTDLTGVMGFKHHASITARSLGETEEGSPPITDKQPGVVGSFGVRRLTPNECARLQGFPDGWNAEMSDSTRYRQFGNAVCVPVIEWIGKRIVEVESCCG